MLRANFAQTNHKRKGVVIMTTIFALDVGNKQTKFKSKDYEGVFPSALINQRDVQSVFSLGTPEGLTSAKVNGDSQAYYCGQGVLNYSQNKLLDSLGFGDRYKREVYHLLNEFALNVLAKKSTEKLDDIHVIAGLPTGDYTKEVIDEIKTIFLEKTGEDFKARTHLVTVDDEEVLTKVTDVTVLPQPIGTFYNEVLKENGDVKQGELVSKRVAIVDIGGGTLLLDELDNVQLDTNYRIQLETGANTLYSDLRSSLMKRYSLNTDLHKIELMVREGLADSALENARFVYRQSDNNRFDVTEIVLSAVQHWTNTIINNVFTTFQNLNEVDAVIVTGGSASIIDKQAFADAFSDSTKVIFVDEPELANVRGFYKYGKLHDTQQEG